MIHPIRLYGDPVLRRPAAAVDRFDDDLARLADDMIETMHDAHGVGLAAPQIGISKRIFVAGEVATKPSDPADDAEHDDRVIDDAAIDGDEADGDEADGEEADEMLVAVHVMVNPEIVARHGEQTGPDGCLSVPGLWIEDMRRDAEITVSFQSLDGTRHERTVEGHFAHVVQHELDHLDGVLYFDRLEDEDRRRFLEAHRTELADMQRRAKALIKELRHQPVPSS